MWYLAVIALVVFLVIIGVTARRLRLRILATEQLAGYQTTNLDEAYAEEDRRSWLRQWLYVARYRKPSAPDAFLAATFGGFVVGSIVTIWLLVSGLLAMSSKLLMDIPGNVGLLLMPALLLAPVMTLLIPTMIPMLLVRARRRRVVQEIGEDFPIFMDLLATLTEGGLGFDQALDRIVSLQPGDRVLSQEVRLFQADLVAGQRRVDALRRMADRIDVPALTNFTSAVAQAEQTGSGLARTVRVQADDFREYRRNEALLRAQKLAIKLVIPMVLFFAPALFVSTLGPTIYRIIVRLGQFVEDVAPPQAGGGEEEATEDQ